MPATSIPLTVFTKPWKNMSLHELGEFVAGLGFNGIELPVRPEYQVLPEKVETHLPLSAKVLAEFGLGIHSVAGPTDERTIAACGEAGVPMIRVCVNVDREKGYMKTIDALRKEYDALIPALDKHGVAIGVQNHCGFCIGSAIGLMHAIEPFEPKHVCAVLDVAHCGLDGEPEDMAIDITWPALGMVNLKNALLERGADTTDPTAATWRPRWVSGREGFASWQRTAESLATRGYEGPVCLTAEYSDHDSVDRMIAEDIAFAKRLFREDEGVSP